MSQSTYAFLGSRLHLVLDDKVAEAYNRYSDNFIQAQFDHEARTGSKWTPDQPLWMEKDDEAADAWGKIGALVNQLIEINGGSLDLPEEECTADDLVKL